MLYMDILVHIVIYSIRFNHIGTFISQIFVLITAKYICMSIVNVSQLDHEYSKFYCDRNQTKCTMGKLFLN